ncbi:hypothetical protein Fbal_2674 [Ferrimonas balearica DSM 9799]|uniref:Uncharacterized protein n=1 Tax=Ferrimonas balearica (strain DSM 9799 / CCM 4581 / KCTC 23876 / PAT) TaxID=550540 RepID=E1SQV1_FERBD|nr:hypothetical protein [Ferrimonas balearica]ADN76876.1 hypothetical protein Fbal_2674 [Ferrimonas balearica DSM 9799]
METEIYRLESVTVPNSLEHRLVHCTLGGQTLLSLSAPPSNNGGVFLAWPVKNAHESVRCYVSNVIRFPFQSEDQENWYRVWYQDGKYLEKRYRKFHECIACLLKESIKAETRLIQACIRGRFFEYAWRTEQLGKGTLFLPEAQQADKYFYDHMITGTHAFAIHKHFSVVNAVCSMYAQIMTPTTLQEGYL